MKCPLFRVLHRSGSSPHFVVRCKVVICPEEVGLSNYKILAHDLPLNVHSLINKFVGTTMKVIC